MHVRVSGSLLPQMFLPAVTQQWLWEVDMKTYRTSDEQTHRNWMAKKQSQRCSNTWLQGKFNSIPHRNEKPIRAFVT